MAKIIFVGIHNKPGKTPLDSSTSTGRTIDEIIKHVNGKCIKTNLFDQEVHPEVDRKNMFRLMPHVDDWMKRSNYESGDAIVTLGDLVYGCFSYYNKARRSAINPGKPLWLFKLYHPASRWVAMHKAEFLKDAIYRINHNFNGQ